MQYLIGMGVTFAAFAIMLWIHGRKPSNLHTDLIEHWKINNEQAKIKNATLIRIAEALESGVIQP